MAPDVFEIGDGSVVQIADGPVRSTLNTTSAQRSSSAPRRAAAPGLIAARGVAATRRTDGRENRCTTMRNRKMDWDGAVADTLRLAHETAVRHPAGAA